MYKDKIITLDNGIEYLIINQFDFDGRRFVVGAMVDTEKDLIDKENLLIKEIVSIEGEDHIVTIEDQKTLETVTRFLGSKEAMGL